MITSFIYTNGTSTVTGRDVTIVGDWISVDTKWQPVVMETVDLLLITRPELKVMNFADYADPDFDLSEKPVNDLVRYAEELINKTPSITKFCVMIDDSTGQIMIGDDTTTSFNS